MTKKSAGRHRGYLLARADLALYEAKGRNRTIVRSDDSQADLLQATAKTTKPG